MSSQKSILGIDPGTNIMGYGIVKIVGNKACYEDMGIFLLTRISDPYEKLKRIFRETCKIIDKYHPDEMAIEAPFYGKNVQSMLKLGRAQGVAISAGLSRDLPIYEYAPRKIKMAITGKGAASKEQVAGMLDKILKLPEIPANLDATDGLAVALCHFFQQKPINPEKSFSSWEEFIRKNPDKIK